MMKRAMFLNVQYEKCSVKFWLFALLKSFSVLRKSLAPILLALLSLLFTRESKKNTRFFLTVQEQKKIEKHSFCLLVSQIPKKL